MSKIVEYPFIVLRQMKIVEDNLLLISKNDDYIEYDYFEYEFDSEDYLNLEDGYEVIIFSFQPTSTISGRYTPKFETQKKFLSKSFLGSVSPGDIGVLHKSYIKNSVTLTTTINEETFNEYYQTLYDYHTSLLKLTKKETLQKIISILITNKRDREIEKIVK